MLTTQSIRSHTRPLQTTKHLDLLIQRIGNARIVMLGEASHGTHQYYTWRARITKQLIQHHAFNFIAVEGDWPDCYEMNRFAKGYLDPTTTARNLLVQVERWPTWMWANWEIVELLTWLKEHNVNLDPQLRVGFFGLDVYSLWESMHAILEHLAKSHPEALEAAQKALKCFEPFGRDPQEYASFTRMVPESCEEEILDVLKKLQSSPVKHPDDPEAHFNAEQNAFAAVNAELYYRTMVRADRSSWNVRDTHMMDTLHRLLNFHGSNSKAIVWAHNTHVGDARYTDMAEDGLVNIGQLARERYGEDQVVLVGFGSYEGSVIAGKRWGAPMEKMPVPQAQPSSWEASLHGAAGRDCLILTEDLKESEYLTDIAHRAIGVVYQPYAERLGNYVPTVIPRRYDAFIYLDKTQALHPLHMEPHATPDPPETYPWGE